MQGDITLQNQLSSASQEYSSNADKVTVSECMVCLLRRDTLVLAATHLSAPSPISLEDKLLLHLHQMKHHKIHRGCRKWPLHLLSQHNTVIEIDCTCSSP